VNFLEITSLAFRSIWQNGTRTIITCCIIGFGIMSLVGILTAIDGLKTYLNKDFSSMGANTFKVRNRGLGVQLGKGSEPPKVYRPITLQEAIDFQQLYRLDHPNSVQIIGSMVSIVKHKDKESNPNIYVFGTDDRYIDVEGYVLESGRNFSQNEMQDGANVCILGNELAIKLFGAELDIDGKTVLVDGRRFRVIGVLNAKGSSFITSDNFVLMPLNKARQHYQSSQLSYLISIRTDTPEELEAAIEEATGAMRLARKLGPREDNNFEIFKSDSISELLVEKLEYATLGGFIIGIITLFGAAIGLMNIMLVSVTERTKEIGTLKAIGARSGDILRQFLLEAIVICQLGGGLGIILGISIGNVVSILIGGSFIVPWAWITLGIAFCLIVGLISGIYPAIKASQQDPIEALRYE
jgi:putative ABC transport system permease protein